jgi:hypothetical protein
MCSPCKNERGLREQICLTWFKHYIMCTYLKTSHSTLLLHKILCFIYHLKEENLTKKEICNPKRFIMLNRTYCHLNDVFVEQFARYE